MFDKKDIEINQTVNAGKQKIADDNAWDLLKKADEIVVGRGKKFLVFNPSSDDQDAILTQCLGRTGNLRAPTLKIGNRYIVGFTDAMYQQYVE